MKARLQPLEAPARAQRYVAELRSFYITLIFYALVNVGAWAFNLISGTRLWAYWITLGWGLGLAIWGARFFLRSNDWFLGHGWEERQVQLRLAKENLKVVSNEKQLLQAQLRLLQAQIEPHFLFNTLANVQSLIQRAPEKANTLLEGLIVYLRQSLTSSRSASCTVETEIQLVQRYLELLQIRMGERLQYRIQIPAQVAKLAFAPLLLQPLVENAIRHGLEPKVQGGTIQINGRLSADGRVTIEVVDDGLGFKPVSVDGVGLSNVRERLALLFDGKAAITITDAKPGTRAQLIFPIES
jgi:sensor histidine kinase YesM